MSLLTGATLVAGVAGAPVGHSLSPQIHSAWIEAAGIDAAYVPFPVARDNFQEFARGMRGGAIRGLNVTIPFKQDALAVADLVEPLAREAGAANLLLFHGDGRIEARNTDGPGLLEALAEAPALDLTGKPVVVLGAGGAGRGAVAALVAAGTSELRLVNRTLAGAETLAGEFPRVRAIAWDRMDEAFEGAGVVINATSAGLNGANDLIGLPLPRLAKDAVVMDMVYKPLETALLRDARAAGFATVDGLSMLINQAKPSFQAFYGLAPPPEVDVRALALAALGG